MERYDDGVTLEVAVHGKLNDLCFSFPIRFIDFYSFRYRVLTTSWLSQSHVAYIPTTGVHAQPIQREV